MTKAKIRELNWAFVIKKRMLPAAGIAPASPPLQGGANLPQLHGVNAPPHVDGYRKWSFRVVTLQRLPVISRALCF